MLINEDMLSEQVNEMTGEIPPYQTVLPSSYSSTVEPSHPGHHLQGAELREGQPVY